MKKYGKTVKLFLIEGEPNGRITCELSNWNGKAYKIPRTLIKNCADREDLNSTGIYFLFGSGDGMLDSGKVYIGEAEDVLKRLTQHLKSKDFWNETIVFISKDNNLNKAHIKYLENRLYDIIEKVGRYDLVNNQIPNKPTISESEEAEMEEFISNIRFLVNILGHKILEEKRETEETLKETEEQLFYINSVRGGEGIGKQTSEGFIVFKDSGVAEPITKSYPKTMKKLRDELISKGIIKKSKDRLILERDYIFSSSSSAAMIIMGRSANGLTEWKTKDGNILRDIENN